MGVVKHFFTPNITRAGRVVRAVWGLVLLATAGLVANRSFWACGLLALAGIFAIYEALRGWCVMRACGIKTKL